MSVFLKLVTTFLNKTKYQNENKFRDKRVVCIEMFPYGSGRARSFRPHLFDSMFQLYDNYSFAYQTLF